MQQAYNADDGGQLQVTGFLTLYCFLCFLLGCCGVMDGSLFQPAATPVTYSVQSDQIRKIKQIRIHVSDHTILLDTLGQCASYFWETRELCMTHITHISSDAPQREPTHEPASDSTQFFKKIYYP